MKKTTRANIRTKSVKKKIALLGFSSLLFSGTVFAHQTFVIGGWNNSYGDRFNPTLSQSTAYDNAKINKTHYSWAQVGGGKQGFSKRVSANQISYAKAIGAWNGAYKGWYVAF